MTVLLCIVGYVAAGAWYGRTQVGPCYRAAKEEWKYDDIARESMAARVGWRVAFWPAAMVFDAWRPTVKRWFTAQLDEDDTP